MLLEGAALLCVVCGGLFWLTLALDWAYFRLTAMELAAVVPRGGGRFGRRPVGRRRDVLDRAPLLRPVSARALALVLERRFPELGTRLITAVEMAEARSGHESPLTSAMIERTIDEAARMSSALPLESVFDRAPLRRALVAAALLVGSVGGL